MTDKDKLFISTAINEIDKIASDIAIILVINTRDKPTGQTDYGRFSILNEYFSETELDSLLNGFKSFVGYTDVSYSEKEFISKLASNHYGQIAKKYKIVYNNTGSGVFKCKSGIIPGICDFYKLPYCSNDAYTSSLLENKVHLFNLLRYYKFPIAPFWVFDLENRWHNNEVPPQNLKLIAKPAYQCSSIGIDANSVSEFTEEYAHYIETQSDLFKQPLIIQQFISGYEVEIPIFDLDKPIAPKSMGVSIESAKFLGDAFLSYDQIEKGSYDYFSFDDENSNLAAKLKAISLDSYKILDLTSVIRVDYRISGNDYFITDYNNTPHLNEFHSFGKAFTTSGYSYADMLKCLCYTAYKKIKKMSISANQ